MIFVSLWSLWSADDIQVYQVTTVTEGITVVQTGGEARADVTLVSGSRVYLERLKGDHVTAAVFKVRTEIPTLALHGHR